MPRLEVSRISFGGGMGPRLGCALAMAFVSLSRTVRGFRGAQEMGGLPKEKGDAPGFMENDA